MRLILLIAFLILRLYSSAQNISIAWEKEFSSSSKLYCRIESSVQTDDGAIFILASNDSVYNYSVVKLTNKGKVAWTYRIEECNDGPNFSSYLHYEVKIKNNSVYVFGQEKLKNMYHEKCPNDPAHYFILCLDSKGKKIFHNRYEGTYGAIVIRDTDILHMKHTEDYDSLDVKIIGLNGKHLLDKRICSYSQNIISATITDKDELIVLLSNRVLKFNKELISEIEMEYDLEFNPRFGTKLHILPTGEILLAYSTYSWYNKSTIDARYKLHLLNFNLSTKEYWLKVIGDSLNGDYFIELHLEKDYFFVTHQSANPASEYYSLDSIHLLKYSYAGELVGRTSFDCGSFGTSLKVKYTDGEMKIFSVPHPIDFRKSGNEMITYTQINTEGEKVSRKIPFEGHKSFKVVNYVYWIATNEYLLFVGEPYTSSVIRIKIE